MSDLKRVVLDGYPAEKLPDEIRGSIDPTHKVRITVEEMPGHHWHLLREKIDDFHRANPGTGVTSETAVDRIRALRDEWD